MENRNPLSPHIQIYRWHISSLVSISHRITGIINIVAITLICIWTASLILGDTNYDFINSFLTSIFGKFIVIGLAMINALTNKSISMVDLLFTDFLIVGVTLGIELIWFNNHERSKTIVYEKIEMIKPIHNDELMADLRERTGLDVFKFTIGNVDFLKDVASIKIYYKEKK